jgi:hypothetical protein
MSQVVLWVAIPSLLERGEVTIVMTVFLIIFLFQYLPKIYHSVCLLRRMQNLSGYIFGTVWWGIALNLIAYFVASHVSSPFHFLHDLYVKKVSLLVLRVEGILVELIEDLVNKKALAPLLSLKKEQRISM